MSTIKLCRCVAVVFFSAVVSYPFHTSAKALTPNQTEDTAPALQQGQAKSGVIAGKGLQGRRVIPAEANSARPKPTVNAVNAAVSPEVSATSGSILTGSGAITEVEPNDQVAQNVFMPVNIGGTMHSSKDQDVYAFPILAGQTVTVDAFAARIGSGMTPVVFLLDSTGTNILAEAEGDGFGDDPFVQYTSPSRTTLITVISDEFGFSGSGIFYILNIEAGVDVMPNVAPTGTPDPLPPLDVSVFGNMTSANEVDHYTFQADQGQTLIAACEASVYGGSLVSQLQLIDPASKIVYFTADHNDLDDPRFNIVLPFTGTYEITVSAIDSSPGGEYDLNLELVPSNSGPGAPTISSAVHTKAKLVQVTGTQLSGKSIVEANSLQRPTSKIKKGVLQGHVTGGTGTVITVANLPDLRRSNPIILP